MKRTAAVVTVSDKGARGERQDTSGPALGAILAQQGFEIVYTAVVPDEGADIQRELIRCADELRVALVLTTGGTGFSPRDVTPEATRAVMEREAPGIPEAMRAASMRITPRGCLSRGVAGIRGGTLMVNLPGSEKAARENLLSVLDGLLHGLDMLASAGSADCAQPVQASVRPSLDQWLREAQSDPAASQCGMYLFHTGVVRSTPKAQVRDGEPAGRTVRAVDFSYDEDRLAQALLHARAMPGVFYARAWLNRGVLPVGSELMLVLVGGDIRPHVVDALQSLVAEIKTACVTERELY